MIVDFLKSYLITMHYSTYRIIFVGIIPVKPLDSSCYAMQVFSLTMKQKFNARE